MSVLKLVNYRNVLQQQCNLEQRILKNVLALATHSPDAFAYHVMEGPGYGFTGRRSNTHSKMCISRGKTCPNSGML